MLFHLNDDSRNYWSTSHTFQHFSLPFNLPFCSSFSPYQFLSHSKEGKKVYLLFKTNNGVNTKTNRPIQLELLRIVVASEEKGFWAVMKLILYKHPPYEGRTIVHFESNFLKQYTLSEYSCKLSQMDQVTGNGQTRCRWMMILKQAIKITRQKQRVEERGREWKRIKNHNSQYCNDAHFVLRASILNEYVLTSSSNWFQSSFSLPLLTPFLHTFIV